MDRYTQYANHLCSDIPNSELDLLIRQFIKEAEVDMGSDFEELAIPRVREFVTKDFSHLPLYFIAGAFKKGSLGQYGPGRLVPRTIHGWLSEMSQVFQQHSKNLADNIDDKKRWDGLNKYPVGKAINKKIDWLISGAISESDWDELPLKEMAERIGQGLEVHPELWNIKTITQ